MNNENRRKIWKDGRLIFPGVMRPSKPDLVPASFDDCLSYEDQIIKLRKEFEEVAEPTFEATGTLENDGGDPSVSIETERQDDGTVQMDFTFKNVGGVPGPEGPQGQTGPAGQDGYSPEVTLKTITGGTQVKITDEDHPEGQTFNVMDGSDGADGSAATIAVGTVTTGEPGTNASVENTGTSSAAVLNFTIPRGATGATGESGAAGSDGVSPGVAIAEIIGGHSVTITDAEHPLGQTFDVMDGSDCTDGTDGVSPTVSVTAIAGGHQVAITDAQGTDTFDVMDGADGRAGSDGAAATIAVGTVTTGNPGTNASVVNAGSSSAAVFNFTIPRGAKGATGATGPQGPAGTVDLDIIADEYVAGTRPVYYNPGDVVSYQGGYWVCRYATSGEFAQGDWEQIYVCPNQWSGTNVAAGDYVIYDNTLYQNTSGASTYFQPSSPGSAFTNKGSTSSIPAYSAGVSVTFSAGDFCIYNEKLYKAKASTSGAWDSSKWDEVNVMSQVSSGGGGGSFTPNSGLWTFNGDYSMSVSAGQTIELSGTWDQLNMLGVGRTFDVNFNAAQLILTGHTFSGSPSSPTNHKCDFLVIFNGTIYNIHAEGSGTSTSLQITRVFTFHAM